MFDFKIDKINSLQILDRNTLEPIAEFEGISDATIDTEIEPSSISKEALEFNHSASFKGELIDCSLFNYNTTNFNGKPFYVEYHIPIMIQSRWHKKSRINKKWLKRYGMKKDNVLVKCDVLSIHTNTECENLYEIEHEFNLDLGSMEYKFRPDQLRKNLKIEMYYA